MQNELREGYTWMQDHFFSGRTPVAYMVITGPPTDAEAGHPRLANNTRPIKKKKRMYTNFFILWLGFVYPLSFPVDVDSNVVNAYIATCCAFVRLCINAYIGSLAVSFFYILAVVYVENPVVAACTTCASIKKRRI